MGIVYIIWPAQLFELCSYVTSNNHYLLCCPLARSRDTNIISDMTPISLKPDTAVNLKHLSSFEKAIRPKDFRKRVQGVLIGRLVAIDLEVHQVQGGLWCVGSLLVRQTAVKV